MEHLGVNVALFRVGFGGFWIGFGARMGRGMGVQFFGLSVGRPARAVHEPPLPTSQSGVAAHVSKGYWDSSTGVRGHQDPRRRVEP